MNELKDKLKTLSKNDKRVLAALVIVLVVYSVVAFAVPFSRGVGFAITYLITVVTIAAQAAVLYSAFCKGENPRSKLYGFPLARIGLSYAAAQVVVGLVFMALGKWLPLWLQILVQVILLGAAALGYIAADTVRDTVEAQEAALKTDVAQMRGLQAKSSVLAGQCNVAEVAQLAEELRYSDPVSNKTVAEQETELAALLDEMQRAATDGDNAAVQTLAKQGLATLKERDRLCKLGK